MINCSLIDPDGVKIQDNIIDVSGDVTLNLKDKFGALTVVACDELNCI